jgi:hypothetical protein
MFPHHARERRYAGDGARPEPVERVSRRPGSTTSDSRLRIPETQATRLPLQRVRGPWSVVRVKAQRRAELFIEAIDGNFCS